MFLWISFMHRASPPPEIVILSDDDDTCTGTSSSPEAIEVSLLQEWYKSEILL